MAPRIRAEHNVSANSKKQAAKNASSKLAGKAKAAPQLPGTGKPRTLPALMTEEQFNVIVQKCSAAEDRYNKKKATAKADVATAKTEMDDTFTTAAVTTMSRSISLRTLKKLVARERQRAKSEGEAEVTAEVKGELWGMKALRYEVGEQLNMFDTPADKEKALKRAFEFGVSVAVRSGGVAEVNERYNAGSDFGQEALRGYHKGTEDNLLGKNNPANKGKVTNLADAKKARETAKNKTAAAKRKGTTAPPPSGDDAANNDAAE